LNRCREEAEDNLNSVSKEEYKERFLKAMAEYETIGDEKKVEWKLERRQHLLKQNFIKERYHCGDTEESKACLGWNQNGHQ
jgi:hypothetical protein